MAFPPSAYTLRGGVGTVAAHARAMAAMEDVGKDAGESDGCERASDPTDAALDAEVPVELVGADGSPSDQVTTQQAA